MKKALTLWCVIGVVLPVVSAISGHWDQFDDPAKLRITLEVCADTLALAWLWR